MCAFRLVVLASLGCLLGAPAHGAERTRIVIHVIDSAGTDSGHLIQAEHTVMRLFGAAGVDTVWREERSPPVMTDKTHDVVVVILSRPKTEPKVATDDTGATILATAAPAPARRAWIFLERVNDAAWAQGQAVGPVLGQVIAHEVAHVVAHLPHSQCGTMAARLNLSRQGCEGFTLAERDQIRTALTRVEATAARARTPVETAFNRQAR